MSIRCLYLCMLCCLLLSCTTGKEASGIDTGSRPYTITIQLLNQDHVITQLIEAVSEVAVLDNIIVDPDELSPGETIKVLRLYFNSLDKNKVELIRIQVSKCAGVIDLKITS